MNDDTIPQTVLFPDLFNKPLVATFDQPHASSDGGAILLKAADARYGLIEGFARCLVEDRQPGKVRHTLEDLLAQRIFGLACGHPDANDADRLADDPIHKLLLGRDPIDGDPLASQPTLSRFENQVGAQELYALGRELAASVIARHRRRLHGRARTITIDLDPTDDPTHGAQQLTFFNGHYDSWCYLPLLAFVTFNDEVEQYLCAAILRPGNAPATRGARGTLIRLLDLLRHAFPTARFLVRLDGGFATPAIFDRLDAEPGLDYVVAMGENAVLARCAEPAMREARAQSEASGQTEHVYSEARYAAGTWPHERRVVMIIFNRLRADPGWQQLEKTGEYFDPYVEYIGQREPDKFAFYVQELFWQLVIDGILAPGMNPWNMDLPWFHVTLYGRHVLDAGEYQPYDPTEYLRRLVERVGTPDETVLAYVGESLQTFRRRSLIASMMMLGVAAERVFILLCDSMRAALKSPKELAKFDATLSRPAMKPRLDWMHAKVQHLQQSSLKEFPDNATLMIMAIYDLIRIQRNDLGHPRPTPPKVDVEEAFANLQIFPRYYETAEVLRKFLGSNQV